VLLIEDNPGDARLLQEAFGEAHGARFRLVHVERLAEGISLLEKEEYHAVLLDLSLPDARGLESLVELHARAPGIPIIVLTGLDDEAIAVQALRKGAQDYLVKGYTDGNLLARAMRYAIERKRAEEEKRRLQEQLAHAQKMQALGTLAGGMAHEFNNINAAVIGYLDLTLQTETLSATARRNLEIVRSSASRGADLTKSLLAFSRKQLGPRERVNLREIVDEVLRVTGKEFTSEGIEVTVGHSTRVPPVTGDPGLLTHVVLNLVINARHAMLGAPVKKLSLETGVDRGRPFVSVRDTGCGIPKEDIPRVFEPFFTTKASPRAERAHAAEPRGTGLGLSVSHSIVQGHGGEIKVDTQVRKGTRFTVYLPAAPESPRPRREAGQRQTRCPARVIIVDDEKEITDLIVQILSGSGYAADGFTHPGEALRALRHGRYAVALIDLQMPDMKGMDFMRRVNGLPAKRRPLKVILTGRIDDLAREYAHLGIFATLRKPFSKEQVLDIVEEGLAANALPADEMREESSRPQSCPD
jgi:signal transduction histidine kinase